MKKGHRTEENEEVKRKIERDERRKRDIKISARRIKVIHSLKRISILLN